MKERRKSLKRKPATPCTQCDSYACTGNVCREEAKKKRKKYQLYKIDIPIYNDVLHVFVGKFEEFLPYTRNKYKVTFAKGDINSDGRYYAETQNSPAFIVIPEFNWTIAQQATVVHEILHYVFYMLDKRGLTLSSESEEAYTYLVEYIMKKIWLIFKSTNDGKEIKKS